MAFVDKKGTYMLIWFFTMGEDSKRTMVINLVHLIQMMTQRLNIILRIFKMLRSNLTMMMNMFLRIFNMMKNSLRGAPLKLR
ncbi:hypothetical protein CRG98_033520 [Punica granatum]|uniref:Uncharacterized protein n=1 Tax=Punica granatum TaxID=22663 RepID=A0A2I0IPY5_PUNGR|nr:hypothetical protein CRG98_033520 [Punica granatum]